MNIVIIWHKIPSPYDGSSMSIYHLLKHCAAIGHRCTVITYDEGTLTGAQQLDELRQLCDSLELVGKPDSMPERVLRTVTDILFSPALVKNHILPVWFYSKEMQRKTNKILAENKFDLLYCSRPMLAYILNSEVSDLPRILDFDDPGLYASYQLFLNEKGLIRRSSWLLRHYLFKLFEVKQYTRFSACIFVAEIHKQIMEQYLPRNNYVVHYGVDLDYFEQVPAGVDDGSLVFCGSMAYSINENAMIDFCDKILPLIQKRKPGIKLYIVGEKPSREILGLASDTITVTGFVDDIRPYFSNASVVVVPIVIDDGGFKIKILEAMAMSKAVVSTTVGAKTIDVTDGKNILLADDPGQFADKVVELLDKPTLRREIAVNGRKFVENEYSWSSATSGLINVFLDVANREKNEIQVNRETPDSPGAVRKLK